MSNNIGKYRKFMGLTQKQLAEKMNIPVITLHRYEAMTVPKIPLTFVIGFLKLINNGGVKEEITIYDLFT